MMIIHALEGVLDLLPYFAIVTIFRGFRNSWMVLGAVLGLVFISALVLEKYNNIIVKVICALLPCLGLFAASSMTEVYFTIPALLLWILVVSQDMNTIYYSDYKFWFGIPAMVMPVVLLVALTSHMSRLPASKLSILCASADLAVGIFVLRRKRMGAGVSLQAKFLNVAEMVVASLSGILACGIVWRIVVLSRKVIEMLLLPVGIAMNLIVSFLSWAFGVFMDDDTKYEEAEKKLSIFNQKIAQVKDDTLTPKDTKFYASSDIVLQVVSIAIFLSFIAFVLLLLFRVIKYFRKDRYTGYSQYEDTYLEESTREKRKKRKRKKIELTNNHKVREIYREYMQYLWENGIIITWQNTSEEILTASQDLVDIEEARELRGLYIRARYNDVNILSDEEVLRAKEILESIKRGKSKENIG